MSHHLARGLGTSYAPPGIDNYAHAQTVDTRPFFLGWVGPGNEASIYPAYVYSDVTLN